MANDNVCPSCGHRWQTKVVKPKRCKKCHVYFDYLPCGRKRVFVPKEERYYAGRPRGTGGKYMRRSAIKKETPIVLPEEVKDTKVVKYIKKINMEAKKNG